MMIGTVGIGAETAPETTLRALREIDPCADLVHLGEDQWLLGVRVANPAARDRLEKQLRVLAPHRNSDGWAGQEFQLLQLYADGFRPIMLYTLGGEGVDELGRPAAITFDYIVDDFRIRDFNWRVRPREAEAEFRSAISLDEGNKRRANVLADFMDQEGGSLFRHVMRQARSFIQRVALPNGG